MLSPLYSTKTTFCKVTIKWDTKLSNCPSFGDYEISKLHPPGCVFLLCETGYCSGDACACASTRTATLNEWTPFSASCMAASETKDNVPSGETVGLLTIR